MTALVVFDLEAVLNFELARKHHHITRAFDVDGYSRA